MTYWRVDRQQESRNAMQPSRPGLHAGFTVTLKDGGKILRYSLQEGSRPQPFYNDKTFF